MKVLEINEKVEKRRSTKNKTVDKRLLKGDNKGVNSEMV